MAVVFGHLWAQASEAYGHLQFKNLLRVVLQPKSGVSANIPNKSYGGPQLQISTVGGQREEKVPIQLRRHLEKEK